MNKLRVAAPPSLEPRNAPCRDAQALSRQAFAIEALDGPLRSTTVTRSGPQQPRIISSAHGRIEHVLMCYPAYAEDSTGAGGSPMYSDYSAAFRGVLRTLPIDTELTVVAHPSVVDDLTGLIQETRAGQSTNRIVPAPPYLNFTVWAEDPYIVVEDQAADGDTFFVEPLGFPRVGDNAIAQLVVNASSDSLKSMQSPLIFQGGNILVGDTFILLGVDYLLDTWETFSSPQTPVEIPDGSSDSTDAFIRGLFKDTFDPARELVIVGTSLPVPREQTRAISVDDQPWTETIYLGTGFRQPIFHIDMFISLAGRAESGRYRVLVGSPAEADRILQRPPSDHGLAAIFDDIATRLEPHFEVHRNPLPLTYCDDPASQERYWYFATSNNCLVEIDGDSKQVWLPTYGYGPWDELQATDAANRRIWEEELGFEVHDVGDFHVFAQRLGSVHCIKKYVSRGG